ncbi:MAG: hypothetical protein V3V74_07285 [Nitrosomonadaceae bacterium]
MSELTDLENKVIELSKMKFKTMIKTEVLIIEADGRDYKLTLTKRAGSKTTKAALTRSGEYFDGGDYESRGEAIRDMQGVIISTITTENNISPYCTEKTAKLVTRKFSERV